MLTGQLALLTAAVFAGAALYINVVEQPARPALDHGSLLAEWKRAYKRGTAMQAPLAIAGFVLGLAAWWQTGSIGWAIGALLMIANWPVTFFAILPTNKKLMAVEPSAADLESRTMVEKWGSLHARASDQKWRPLLGPMLIFKGGASFDAENRIHFSARCAMRTALGFAASFAFIWSSVA